MSWVANMQANVEEDGCNLRPDPALKFCTCQFFCFAPPVTSASASLVRKFGSSLGDLAAIVPVLRPRLRRDVPYGSALFTIKLEEIGFEE